MEDAECGPEPAFTDFGHKWTDDEVEGLRGMVYGMSNSAFPLSDFFNDVFLSEDPRLNKDAAYSGLYAVAWQHRRCEKRQILGFCRDCLHCEHRRREDGAMTHFCHEESRFKRPEGYCDGFEMASEARINGNA